MTAAGPRERVATLANGRRLGYVEYGATEGTPVFAFHGVPASRLSFEFADGPARDAGVRLLSVDRPGIGISPKRKAWSILDVADDCAALADSLGLDRFGVVGWSGGGPYALGAAYRLPERLLGVACCSGVGPVEGPDGLKGMNSIDRLSYRLSKKAPWLLGGVLRSVAVVSKLSPKNALKSFEGDLSDTDKAAMARQGQTPKQAMAFFVEAFRKGGRGVAQDYRNLASPFGFRLEDIPVPVHFWQGDADRMVPVRQFDAMIAAVPNAVPHFCPGEGHLLIYDHIAEVLAVAAGHAQPSAKTASPAG
jgi:pimeloyl-ACP methyl ester carboxylesterase